MRHATRDWLVRPMHLHSCQHSSFVVSRHNNIILATTTHLALILCSPDGGRHRKQMLPCTDSHLT
eukprot:1156818-Pelagomonas_calceolata.AAC.10